MPSGVMLALVQLLEKECLNTMISPYYQNPTLIINHTSASLNHILTPLAMEIKPLLVGSTSPLKKYLYFMFNNKTGIP